MTIYELLTASHHLNEVKLHLFVPETLESRYVTITNTAEDPYKIWNTYNYRNYNVDIFKVTKKGCMEIYGSLIPEERQKET